MGLEESGTSVACRNAIEAPPPPDCPPDEQVSPPPEPPADDTYSLRTQNSRNQTDTTASDYGDSGTNKEPISEKEDDSAMDLVDQQEDTVLLAPPDHPSSDQKQQLMLYDENFMRLWRPVEENPYQFDQWIPLLQYAEQEASLELGRYTFECFLRRYPLCYGYWKKFADLERRNGQLSRAKEVFEQAVVATPLSVDLWVHYLNFVSQTLKDEPNLEEAMHTLFERATKACGRDFRSDKIWDAYLDWKKALKPQGLLPIFCRIFTTPTVNYLKHYEKFVECVNTFDPTELLPQDEYKALARELQPSSPLPAITTSGPATSNGSHTHVATEDSAVQDVTPGDDVKPSVSDEKQIDQKRLIKEKVISKFRVMYEQNQVEVLKRWVYEEKIRRPYFHVKPLETSELENWRAYLEFGISSGDKEAAEFLFERCLVACAQYEEFWRKYITFLHDWDATRTRNAYQRACWVHLPHKPRIHLDWALFEEYHGCFEVAHQILKTIDEGLPGLAMVRMRRVNTLRRAGMIKEAVELLETSVVYSQTSAEKLFYSVKLANLMVKFTSDKAAARKVLRDLLQEDKTQTRVYLQMLDLEINHPPVDEQQLYDLCVQVNQEPDLPMTFRQRFTRRYLEHLEDVSTSLSPLSYWYDLYRNQYEALPEDEPVTSGKRPSSTDTGVEEPLAKHANVAEVAGLVPGLPADICLVSGVDTSAAAYSYYPWTYSSATPNYAWYTSTS